MSALTQAMNEYGAALRGDWGDFDGRSGQGAIETFVSAIQGGPEADWTIDRWRTDLGICPDGGGHWAGSWGHCEEDDGCPSLREGAAG